MKEIKLTINGTACNGIQGDTILDVAGKNGIKIPTLCFMEGLTAIGACRMCVVEVEGNPKMLPACTSPAVDGMTVHTSTPKLDNYRRQVLELLFAGRNHFCMYCSQSGDCELQTLAIAHGMDRVRYPYLYAEFNNDTSKQDLMMDANRCVLCLRCIRVCAEKVGAHTLDLERRGWSACVTTDFGDKWGDSSTCTSCGACAQSCPTGTITAREFAYRGRRSDCDASVDSVCPLCSVGCNIKAYVRTGSIARVEGLDLTGPDAGQLCHNGRWGLPRSTEQERVTTPMIREGAMFREASWDEALKLIADKLKGAAAKKSAGAMASSLCTDEELGAIKAFFKDTVNLDKIDTFDGDELRGMNDGFAPFYKQGVRPFTAANNILKSDLIVNFCADPQEEAPVVASYIRVSTIREGAKLVNMECSCSYCGGTDPFDGISDLNVTFDCDNFDSMAADITEALIRTESENPVEPGKYDEFVAMLRKAEHPVFVIGREALKYPEAVRGIVNMAIASRAYFDDGLAVVPLLASGNSLGSLRSFVGDSNWRDQDLDFLYLYSTGLIPESEEDLALVMRTRFTVIQTPYLVHPLVNMADVLLPAQAWYEREGHYCTIEGARRHLNVIVPPAPGIKDLPWVLSEMSKYAGMKMASPQAASYEGLFKNGTSPDKAVMAK